MEVRPWLREDKAVPRGHLPPMVQEKPDDDPGREQRAVPLESSVQFPPDEPKTSEPMEAARTVFLLPGLRAK